MFAERTCVGDLAPLHDAREAERVRTAVHLAFRFALDLVQANRAHILSGAPSLSAAPPAR